MARIGSIFLSLLFLCFCIYAQTFKAIAPRVVGVGEQFEVKYQVTAQNISNFIAPSLKGITILSGPSTKKTTVVKGINGHLTNNTELSISYVLQSSSIGKINIPPAKINVNGSIISSNSLSIDVQKNPTMSQRSQNIQQKETITRIDERSLFLKASANKTKVVKGEEIIITYKIYTLLPISEYQLDKLPINKGFWIEELDMSQDPAITEELIEGKKYQVATLRKVIVYPQQTGRLVIAPLDIDIVVMMQVNPKHKISTGDPFFDSFFNDPFFQTMQSGYQRVHKNIKSNQIILDVEELPRTEKEFSGAVGDFQISATVNSATYKTNEPVTLKYTISGSGNLSLIDKINLKIPDKFDSYEPRIEDDINKTGAGLSGKRIFEYILIPREEGEFKIPNVEFTFFDINQKKFKTIEANGFKLNIAKGVELPSDMMEYLNEREKYKKRDIENIYTNSIKFRKGSNFIYGKLYLYILLILIPVHAILFIVIRNRITVRNSDVAYVRYKKATKTTMRRLKKAKQYLEYEQRDEFYKEVSEAIWTYLLDRFKIKKIELTFDKVREIVLLNGIDNETVDNLMSLLNNCEYVRYSKVEDKTKMDNLYEQILNTIVDIESQIK